MADENTFIKQLNEAETANDTDIMIIEGEETKKISFLSLFNVFKEKFSKVYKPQTEITKAEYEALSEEEKNNDTMYLITDDNDMYSAGTVAYDNSGSGLSAVDVQGAIDEVSAKSVKNASDISVLNTKLTDSEWITDGICKYRKKNGYVTLDIYSTTITVTAEYSQIIVLPIEYRPSAVAYYQGVSNTGINLLLYVNTAGIVAVKSMVAGNPGGIIAHINFPVG